MKSIRKISTSIFHANQVDSALSVRRKCFFHIKHGQNHHTPRMNKYTEIKADETPIIR